MEGPLYFIQHLFDTAGYVRRGYCGGWSPLLAIIENVSDLMIWGAYVAIPIVLVYAARKRRDLPFKHLFWLFGLFIAACGTTHLMTYVSTKWPAYRLESLIKVVTAAASWGTVFAIGAIAPTAIAMRMPEDLEGEIRERRRAENQLSELNASLLDRTKELERANAELEGFNYMIAHDLRGAIRGIVASSQFVLRDAPESIDEESRQRLERLSSTAVRMSKLVDDLLEFSRLGRSDLVRKDVDLTSLAESVAAEVSTGRMISFDIERNVHVAADPQLTKLVLQNLIQNACKYSSANNASTVKVGAVDTPRGRAIYVQDNGIGFEMKYAEKIFEPFERLHRDNVPGTGIGLANVRRIVERHGGHVWAQSEVGAGSTFYFTLEGEVSGAAPSSNESPGDES